MLPALILWTLQKTLYSSPILIPQSMIHSFDCIICPSALKLFMCFSSSVTHVQVPDSSFIRFRHWILNSGGRLQNKRQGWGHSRSSSMSVALLASVKAHSSQAQCWIRATESESTKWKLKCFITKYLISILPKGCTSLSAHSFFSLFACCLI